jgi:hypothetical protein
MTFDAPRFVNGPVPPSVLENSTSLKAVNVVADVSEPWPPNVNLPLFVLSPIVRLPPIENPFAISRSPVPKPPVLVTVTPETSDSAPVPNATLSPTSTLPALTVTPPENVFAPLSVSDPAPLFVIPNAPEITPPSVTSLGVVNAKAELKLPPPESVKAPVFVLSPTVTAPPSAYAFANTRGEAESLETLAPVTVNVPVPNAVSLPARAVPPLTVAPPANELVPLKVNAPDPFTTNAPFPLIAPL